MNICKEVKPLLNNGYKEREYIMKLCLCPECIGNINEVFRNHEVSVKYPGRNRTDKGKFIGMIENNTKATVEIETPIGIIRESYPVKWLEY